MTRPNLLDTEDAKVAEALRFVGLRINSVYDLANTKDEYPDAIPVLIKMLREVQHPRIKEGIARALTTKGARSVANELVEEFETMMTDEPSTESVKWAIGNALSVAATDATIEGIIRLMRDKKHGWSRSMLPLALTKAKAKRDMAISALLEALHDDELACQAADALARLKVIEAVPALRLLKTNPNKDIQKAATKALKRLDT